MFESGVNTDPTFAVIGVNDLGSELIQLLMSPEIVPGTAPSYQTCKTLLAYHPLGAVLAEAPIKRAQGQLRILRVPVLGEKRIIKQFEETWKTLGKIGATKIIRNLMTLSRAYGIASIAVGERDKDPSTPLDIEKLDAEKLYFNVLDPLNTAGSLVLNQDPNSPMFLKQGELFVNGKRWHPSRTIARMNGDPLYIEWSNSAFGFVGRSVYQGALYPLKTFIQSMVTDQMVTQKAGLLVAKLKTPGSFIDNIMGSMFGVKRAQIKAGVTGQVLQIGIEEEVEALKLEHLAPAAEFARVNCIKNVATAAGMPASIIAQETLTEGFGEGTEDAKKEAAYLNDLREEMEPAYAFLDRLVQRIAWTEEFYDSLKSDYRELRSYDTWLYDCMAAFEATWPNIIIEPESEKSKTQDVQMKAVVALLETLLPALDPENKAKLIVWASENANEREELFASKLSFDEEVLGEYLEEHANDPAPGEDEEEPREPATFQRGPSANALCGGLSADPEAAQREGALRLASCGKPLPKQRRRWCSRARITRCKHGHNFSGDNVFHSKDGHGT